MTSPTVPAGTGSVFARDLRSKIRTPWPYVESLADPVLLLVLFGPLLAGLGELPGMPAGGTLQWFAPGILVLMAFSTSAFIGAGLQEERQVGSLERMLVTPLHRVALLAGRVLRVVVTVLIQTVVVVLATIPFGLDVPVLGALVALVQLGMFAAALGVASLAVGLMLKDAYAFWGVVTLVYTPIIVSSGALLPMEVAPTWLYAVSRINPLAHTVEAQRLLFAGDLFHPSVLLGFAATLALGLVGTVLGTRAMARIRI